MTRAAGSTTAEAPDATGRAGLATPAGAVDIVVLAWHTPQRHYRAIVQRDLFGDWEFIRIWGGRGSRQGGFKVQPVPDREAGLRLLRLQAGRRLARGYAIVQCEVAAANHPAEPIGG